MYNVDVYRYEYSSFMLHDKNWIIFTIPHKYLLGNQDIWLVSLSWCAWL